MVNIDSSRCFEYKEIKFGKLSVSEHAFQRFEGRVLKNSSAKSFEDLKELFKTVLDGCILVKYKGDMAFYHKEDCLVFATSEYSTNSNDVKFISTVIKDIDSSKVDPRDGKVSFENGEYNLIFED